MDQAELESLQAEMQNDGAWMQEQLKLRRAFVGPPVKRSIHIWTWAEFELTNVADALQRAVAKGTLQRTPKIDQVVTWYDATLRADPKAPEMFKSLAVLNLMTWQQQLDYLQTPDPA